MRVYGQLVPLGAPIVMLNLSRDGFAIVSELAFEAGAILDFRLIAETGARVRVTAEAVHTRPHPSTPGQHLSGFKFVPGRLTGIIPRAAIDRLIEVVMPAGSLLAT